mmetsp:Transcript_15941/g.33453  ORF Transcript_15941/g.33453 Transcript_15941/m.33453 type:complete len:107 (+) Transcript_15941:1052-1372(+)
MKDQEITRMKGTISEQDCRLRAFELELFHLINCGSDRELRHQMKCAYHKFVSTDLSRELITRSIYSKESACQSIEARIKISQTKANHEIKKLKKSLAMRLEETLFY